MRLPYKWLDEFVDLSGISPQEVAERLTMGAFEVEEVRKFGPDIQGDVVIGTILDISAHPNADKIRLTKTRVKEGAEPLEIVCGAQNIEIGQTVPVALPGSKVLNRHDGTDLFIKQSTIRGVTSNGMLCSPLELGLTGQDIDGILILPEGMYRLGEDAKQALALYQDDIFHVTPRSNRGDALSIIGLAREVAALFHRPLKKPSWQLPEAKSSERQTTLGKYEIEIADLNECELFTVRYLENLKIRPSTPQIARRLEAVGIRPISNVVDITNYVMVEYGQPSHSYDAECIQGSKFVIQRANDNEKIKLIDGKERTLTKEVLVIRDAKTSIGLGGVMGGLDSEVSDKTTKVALEAACFQPAIVRRAGRMIGISSEASLRFERGVDLNNTANANNRAAYLMLQHCGGEGGAILGAFSYAGKAAKEPTKVGLRINQLKRFLEVELSPNEIFEHLKPLGFEPAGGVESTPGAAVQIQFLVPSFRQGDVTREIDLVEEVCRIYGYDKIPGSMPVTTAAAIPPEDTLRSLRTALVAQGFSEAYVSSLVPDERDTENQDGGDRLKLNMQDPERLVRVLNPLSKDHQVLRQSLLPGLIKSASYNIDRGEKNVWLFEVGRAYFKTKDFKERLSGNESTAWTAGRVVDEPLKVAGILTGIRVLSPWADQGGAGGNSSSSSNTSEEPDFYLAKGVVENTFLHLGIHSNRIQFVTPQNAPDCFHPGRTAQVVAIATSQKNGSQPPNLPLGYVGEIHPKVAKDLGLEPETYLFELDVDLLRGLRQISSFVPVPTSPAVSRDITVDLPKGVSQAAVASCIKASAGENFKTLELISIFALSAETQSLSYRLTFQHAELTLKNEEVDAQLTAVRKRLTEALGGSFRA
jgi:phenylalanyl-tRNA synthetase beta chain